MAVKPQPDKYKKDEDAFINKGGKAKSDNAEWTMVSLRITKNLLKDLDSMRCNRLGMSRNAWILEAIQEKLK